ncbi:MAG: UDP-3-O-(3-hydroxymyristoyl)glucosamine N-acyltransferase [Granulosicoccus sp.]
MKLGQLAVHLGLPFYGNSTQEILALASIEQAGAEHLCFVVSKRYAKKLAVTRAGAIIVPSELHALYADMLVGKNVLVSENPYASYAKASWLFNPPDGPEPGIHPTAQVHEHASVSEQASVGAFVAIGRGSVVDDFACIESHCMIGSDVHIGSGSHVFPGVSIYNNVRLGSGCRIQSGAVIGSEGFGYAWSDEQWQQIQQTGGVRIGNDVHIGANTTIDCGAIEATVIGDGVIIDNQVQIAHNVQIGARTAIAGCVGIAGSTRIGSCCQIGGACNIVGHLDISDGVVLNAASLVTRSIDRQGRYGSGTPLMAEHAWRRSFVNLGKLDSLFKRVRRLEHRLHSDKPQRE